MTRRAAAIGGLLAAVLAGCGTDVQWGLAPDDRYPSTDAALDDLRKSRAFDAPPFRAATLEAESEPTAQVAVVEEDDDLAVTILDAAEMMAAWGIEWVTASCAGGDDELELALDGSEEVDDANAPFEVHLATGERPGTIVLRVELAPRAPGLVPDPELDPSCPTAVRERVDALLPG